MKFRRRTLLLMTLLALLPLLAVALLYARLPEAVPLRWDLGGNASYGSKAQLWLLAGLSPVLAVLFVVLARIDPKKRSYAKFAAAYESFCIVMLAFLLVIDAIILTESFRPGTVNVGRVVPVLVGLLLLFIGNMLPKISQNYHIGLRTSWTLADPDVWARANRLAGHMMFWGSLLFLPCALFLPETAVFAALMVLVFIIAAVPTYLSWKWYRQKHPDKP